MIKNFMRAYFWTHRIEAVVFQLRTRKRTRYTCTVHKIVNLYQNCSRLALFIMDGLGICEVCQKPAHQKCGGCYNAFYCSKEHQKAGWKNHKKNCRPYKISENEVLGRHLVATKNIREGDVILQEETLLWGPLQVTTPVCLGCGNAVNSKNYNPCSKCGWSLCSKKCEHSLSHIPECYYTTKNGKKMNITTFDIPHPSYQCITPLRFLYQKKFNPDLWKRINTLQSHHEERKKRGKCDDDKIYAVGFIHDFLNLKDEFSEEEILRVCGVIVVNGHEVPLTTPSHVAFFQEASMLEHSCRANCYKTFTSEGKLLVIAGKPIQKDQNITISYTETLWPTFARRKHLTETKFFSCECERCADVTEFGTYFSALKCQKERCDGLLFPESFLNEGSSWICQKCKNVLTANAVHNITNRIGEDLHAMEKGNIENCKKFLEYYGKLLPQNNFYMTDVKLAIIQLIALALKEEENTVTNDDLTYGIKLGLELVELMKILVPGEKRVKGSLAFDIHSLIGEMGRRKAQEGLIGPGDLISILLDCKKFLTEATDCLKCEPEVLPEGKLHQQAKEHVIKLDVLLRSLAENLDNP